MDEQVCFLPNLVLSFQLTIKSDCDEVEPAADRIMSLVQTLPCFQDGCDDLHRALLEALTNAIIHGNREDPGKTVDVCAGCDDQARVVIAVTDHGDGFDPAVLADPTSGENLFAGHGRGVFLMRHLVDEVEFNLGGRQVVLRKRVASAPRLSIVSWHLEGA
jgi:serine/threonine-protein kinase RsbW